MTKDENKKITSIGYNHLNLPTEIIFTGTNKKINYLYNAVGQKVKKIVTSGTSITHIDYLSGYQYRQIGTGTVVLDFFAHAEGYVSNTVVSGVNNYNYVFNYTDHLGNIRLSYTKDPNSEELTILEENNYYPFGLKQNNYNWSKRFYDAVTSGQIRIRPTPRLNYQYKYNGKEYQDELGLNMYDYGNRLYDPARAGWSNIDPLAEKMRRWSPYNYCFNSPMRFTDPDGMSPTDIIRVNSNGFITSIEKTEGLHKVVDDVSGQEYKLNDPNSELDQEQLSNMISAFNFTRGTEDIRVFTPFSDKQMTDKVNSVGIGNIKENYEIAEGLENLGPPLHLCGEAYLGFIGNSSFDFADDMSDVSAKGGNYGQGTGAFPPDGTGGFIKFQNDNSLYNVYDAGNFMTGKALNLIGVPTNAILEGADLNSRATLNGADSAADQRAITNGINYKGIRWKM